MKRRLSALFLICLFSFSLAGENIVINGFDFEGSDFSRGIKEKKVDKYLYGFTESNGRYHAPAVDVDSQVVIGHSQGGLTSLAYAQEMLNRKNNNIKAVITVNSPVTGFAGLDYGYGALRERILQGMKVHDRAISAVMGIGIPAVTNVLDLFPTATKMNFLLYMTEDFPMKPLITKAVSQSSADASMKEIMDMGRQSEFMKTYVRETRVEKRKVISDYRYEVKVFWQRGAFGIRYPTAGLVKVPVYSYYDYYYVASEPYKRLPKVGHVIGTQNDPLRMALDKEGEIRAVKDKVQKSYQLAGGILCIRYFYAPWFQYLSKRCFTAARWTREYKKEWGHIIGGQESDGFITVDSQFLPGNPTVRVHTDHARATPPPLMTGDKTKFDTTGCDPETFLIYGDKMVIYRINQKLLSKDR